MVYFLLHKATNFGFFASTSKAQGPGEKKNIAQKGQQGGNTCRLSLLSNLEAW